MTATITIVSGLPRSGTSLMMRMLEAGGLPVLSDYQRAADEDNPRGYYEYEPVKKLKDHPAVLDDAAGKAVKIISELLLHLPPHQHYHVLFMRRAMPEILASQRQMLQRRGRPTDTVSDAEMSQLFAKHLQRVEHWLSQQPHIAVLYVNYNDLLHTPETVLPQITAFLPMRLDSAAMRQAIDPALYRQRQQE